MVNFPSHFAMFKAQSMRIKPSESEIHVYKKMRRSFCLKLGVGGVGRGGGNGRSY